MIIDIVWPCASATDRSNQEDGLQEPSKAMGLQEKLSEGFCDIPVVESQTAKERKGGGDHLLVPWGSGACQQI